MTSKEKAIEALEEYNEHLTFIPCVRNIPIIDEAIKYLKEPTLDDAIKVVEDIAKTNIDQYFSYDKLIAYEDILTALRGLKGE